MGEPASGPYLPRAFSHARVREDGTLDFLLEAVGPGTQRLAELQPGRGHLAVGTARHRVPAAGEGRTPLLVGGGIGAAPLLCLHDELPPETPVLLGLPHRRTRRGRDLFKAPSP